MKISTKIMLVMAILVVFTISSTVAAYWTAQKFEKLSVELQQRNGFLLSLTSLRAASRQIIVESLKSAYFGNKADFRALEEAIEDGNLKFRDFRKFAPNSNYHADELRLCFLDFTSQLLTLLNEKNTGRVKSVEVPLSRVISEVFQKKYLKLIQSDLEVVEAETAEIQKKYDQEVHVLSLIFPIVLMTILIAMGMYLGPMATLISLKFNQILSSIHQMDFEKDVFPVLPATGKDEFATLSRSFNNLTAALQESKSQIVSHQRELIGASRLASLGEMAGGIAHEINNPLAIISGQLFLMKRRLEGVSFESSPAVLSNISKIEETCFRISKIIQGLRTFARDGTHDVPSEVIVKSVIDDALGLCSERFKVHGVSLSAQGDEQVRLMTRSVQLGQVLVNLLNNAHDAVVQTVTESETPWVKVEWKIENESLWIMVTDSGKGIPPEVLDKIMQPFFTTKAVGVGTGLGLSISQGIIKSMKGELSVNTNCPNTQFVIRLPVDAAYERREQLTVSAG